MTHDELLAKLVQTQGGPVYQALRVVVQLHKPKNYIIKGFEVTESWCTADSESLTPYPCATIQAIEKELNNG
jgi:hypothetical protein